MNRPFEFNNYDFGLQTPRAVSADFGARGREFGIGVSGFGGLTNVGTVSDNTAALEADPGFIAADSQTQADILVAQNAADAANAQVASLTAQLSDLQSQLDANQAQGAQASAAIASSLQQQISDMQGQLVAQKSVVATNQAKVASVLSPYKKYLPMLAVGIVAVIGLAMLVKAKKRS